MTKTTKKKIWYKYTFEDGTWEACAGMSRTELAYAIKHHGKLISKTIFR